tara:strand:- start:69 stop:482 length:414 start_codon:yes stop_codon:yes gene_type:complete
VVLAPRRVRPARVRDRALRRRQVARDLADLRVFGVDDAVQVAAAVDDLGVLEVGLAPVADAREVVAEPLEQLRRELERVLPVPETTSGTTRPAKTSNLSSSVTSKSFRLIFGRTVFSRQVLEAQSKSPAQSVQLRAH